MKPILIDQDGVIADFCAGLYHIVSTELPSLSMHLPHYDQLTTFYIEDSIATGDEDLDRMIKAKVRKSVDNPGLFARLPPIKNAISSLKLLKEKAALYDMNVHICTAPHVENPTCHSDKSNWLISHLGFDWAKGAIMTHDKTLVNGSILVDDKPNIKGSQIPSWKQILFAAPYNRHVELPRIAGWTEANVDFIIEQALINQ